MIGIDETNDDPCAGCGGRREFLRDAAAAAAALLVVGLGAGRAQAQALAPAYLEAVRTRGTEATYPLPAADGVSIDRDREVIVARWHGRVYAFALSCPHQRSLLRWQPAEGRFQCPKHHSRYQPDGAFVSGRATRGMDRHPVRMDGGQLAVELGRTLRQDQDRAAWDAAFVTA